MRHNATVLILAFLLLLYGVSGVVLYFKDKKKKANCNADFATGSIPFACMLRLSHLFCLVDTEHASSSYNSCHVQSTGSIC